MSKSGSKTAVPESRAALDNMKYEVSQQMGINLTKGYNGNLSSKDAGTVGGQMVRKMVEDYQRQHANQ